MSMLAAEMPEPGQGVGRTANQPALRAVPDINGQGNGQSEPGVGGIDSPQENKSTLADRIRALQSTASRTASTN
jgi:hypothetical protein